MVLLFAWSVSLALFDDIEQVKDVPLLTTPCEIVVSLLVQIRVVVIEILPSTKLGEGWRCFLLIISLSRVFFTDPVRIRAAANVDHVTSDLITFVNETQNENKRWFVSSPPPHHT